ncbi:MAG: hypothetical protein GY774_29810 [Planctomycetes bacterium]|nr:hypothetical protein [Planctomycetota bacterium]
MNVPEITEVKNHLEELKGKSLVKEWELPYENLLTRLTAAVFFLEAMEESKLDEVWKELDKHPRLTYRENEEKKLSQMEWRVEFNKDFEL